MSAAETVRKFLEAWEAWDWDAINDYLAHDFHVVGPTPDPINRRWAIADTKARSVAFPDWKFNFRITREEGNVVEGYTQVTGTHTGTLIPAVPGVAPVPPTGKAIKQPPEPTRFTVRGSQIVEMYVETVPGGGYIGILTQLGITPPEKT